MSLRVLLSRRAAVPALAVAFFCLAVLDGAALAGGTYQPPRNGMESPGEPIRRPPREIGAFPNAYGNPVTPEEEVEPRPDRLPSGAYGGKLKAAPERPLPSVPDNRPIW